MRRHNLTLEEENPIHYALGYVMLKIEKQFDSKGRMDVLECLLSMREGTEEEGENRTVLPTATLNTVIYI